MAKVSCGLLTKEGTIVPLTGVEVRGNITGHSARVEVAQSFRNSELKALEVVYKFPLPEGSYISGFKAIIGEKIIQGEVEEREKAFEIYDKALSEGDGAYLLDQEQPNIFTLSLGNLNPGASANVEVEYVTLLDAHNCEARFFLPTTISPRYLPPDTKDKQGIPADEYVNPPIALDASHGLKIVLDIQGKDNIQSLESPSHPISTSFHDNYMRVELTSDSTTMNKDFILNIKYRKDFETAGYVSKKGEDYYIQVDFYPQSSSQPSSIVENQEIVFVLDCSNSMNGSSITEAKQALEILLKALEAGSTFNIYRFGSDFDSLFKTREPYNVKNLDKALNYISSTAGNLGGTEILAPLQAIQRTLVPDKPTSVILLTDGEAGNEEQIIDLVRGEKGRLRMFTVGIGNGPNEYFIKQLARSTGGASELISPNERIEPKVLKLFSKISSTHRIEDFKVDWGTRVTVSGLPSAVYHGETVSVFAKLEDRQALPQRIVLSGNVDKSRHEWVVNITPTNGDKVSLPFLWARTRIRELEESATVAVGSQQFRRKEEKVRQAIVDLSKEFGVISRETSFVAVEKRLKAEKTTGEVALRKVPVMLTQGWGGIMGKVDYTVAISYKSQPMHSIERTAAVNMPDEKYNMPVEEVDLSVRTMNSLRKAGITSVGELISEGEKGTISLKHFGQKSRKEVEKRLKVLGLTLSHEPPEPQIGSDEALFHILSLQKAQGGFEIDTALAKMLKISLSSLRSLAGKIKAKGKPNKFTLFSTALVLKYLEYKHTDRKESWEGVVQKSHRWLQEHIQKNQPTIEEVKLEDWVKRFLMKQI